MYRYTKIAQNMTTSKLMNPLKIGAGVLSKDTRLLPCVWNDNWSIDHSMFCVFSPSSLSHPLPSSKQERFQQNCQFSARRINDPQKHRKEARNEKGWRGNGIFETLLLNSENTSWAMQTCQGCVNKMLIVSHLDFLCKFTAIHEKTCMVFAS